VNGPEDIGGAAEAICKLVDNPDCGGAFRKRKKRTMSLAVSNLAADLDEALTAELIKERGLINIPSEARSTLSSPENV